MESSRRLAGDRAGSNLNAVAGGGGRSHCVHQRHSALRLQMPAASARVASAVMEGGSTQPNKISTRAAWAKVFGAAGSDTGCMGQAFKPGGGQIQVGARTARNAHRRAARVGRAGGRRPAVAQRTATTLEGLNVGQRIDHGDPI